jgi:hypothetical protein
MTDTPETDLLARLEHYALHPDLSLLLGGSMVRCDEELQPVLRESAADIRSLRAQLAQVTGERDTARELLGHVVEYAGVEGIETDVVLQINAALASTDKGGQSDGSVQ